jgi:hypothetical protein
VKLQAAAIRSGGYDGPLSMAVMHSASQSFVIRLLAFKNMQSQVAAQQAIGGFRYVLCRPVSALLHYFYNTLRPILEPKEENPLVFVQVIGQDRGSYYDAKKDGFGRYCGQPNGLNLGTSIRTIRHVVTTEAVRYTTAVHVSLHPSFSSSYSSFLDNDGLLKTERMYALPTCTRLTWPMRTT